MKASSAVSPLSLQTDASTETGAHSHLIAWPGSNRGGTEGGGSHFNTQLSMQIRRKRLMVEGKLHFIITLSREGQSRRVDNLG
ncbi:hypothetical protein PoB_007478100 [Plakobranchus ocellatus]|uniref:Uncharacterized protein n=1 Tax=Plakobranchus ocellatus TaxID=259542 RepID=A0AAV4DVW6_9GAST|nr:hypothetical protein PoB_007478100 [Plakobranchus ocellatus]